MGHTLQHHTLLAAMSFGLLSHTQLNPGHQRCQVLHLDTQQDHRAPWFWLPLSRGCKKLHYFSILYCIPLYDNAFTTSVANEHLRSHSAFWLESLLQRRGSGGVRRLRLGGQPVKRPPCRRTRSRPHPRSGVSNRPTTSLR